METKQALAIEADHIRFYLEGSPFFPKISEHVQDFCANKHNACQIHLDGSYRSEVKWEGAIDQAEKIIEQGGFLFWDLDFGLNQSNIRLDHALFFQCFSLAIAEFNEKIWERFKEYTVGVNLYRGELSYSSLEDESIVAMHQLTDYLHRLGALFPEELLIFASFNAYFFSENPAYLSQILSKERFSHLQLAVAHASIPLFGLNWQAGAMRGGYLGREDMKRELIAPTLAVCLPLDSSFTPKIYHDLNHIFSELNQDGKQYRVIPEAYLTEQWDELDELIVLSEGLSEQGIRKLQGFTAAGGKIIRK